MKLLYKQHKFSKTMIYKSMDDTSYINLIKHPYVIDNKDNIPLVIYGKPKTKLNLKL